MSSEYNIYDDVLDKQFLDYINYKISRTSWQIHASSSRMRTAFFFNSPTVDGNKQNDLYVFLFHLIAVFLQKEQKNLILERGYVNLYPYGIGGDWHVDSPSPHSRTILFYPSDWKEEYGGATEIKGREDVKYKKNRLLIFDATLEHRSAVHTNQQNRYTIAYKTNVPPGDNSIEIKHASNTVT